MVPQIRNFLKGHALHDLKHSDPSCSNLRIIPTYATIVQPAAVSMLAPACPGKYNHGPANHECAGIVDSGCKS